jgi:hypothetical protein
MGAYPLYTPSLAVLGHEGKLVSERLRGWIFILRRGNGPKMIAEVHRRDNNYSFASVSYGKGGSVLLRHLTKPLGVSGGADGELRVLRLPQVHLLALWHHGKGTERIAILPTHGQRSIRRSVLWKDLLPGLQAVAKIRAQFDDRPATLRLRKTQFVLNR